MAEPIYDDGFLGYTGGKPDIPEPVDNVNHPKHYQSNSGLEVIEVIDAFTEGLVGYEAAYTANVLKYVCRWKQKNGIEDLRKAKWYLTRLIDKLECDEMEDAR